MAARARRTALIVASVPELTNLTFSQDGSAVRMRDGKFHFKFRGHAVARAASSLIGDGLHDFRMRVTQNQRAPGTDVVDIFISVGVPQARASRVIDDDRIAAHRAKCAHRAVHSADEHFGRALENILRVRAFHFDYFG